MVGERRRVLLLVALLWVLAACGCSGANAPAQRWAASVAELRSDADRALLEGRTDDAVAALKQLLALDAPDVAGVAALLLEARFKLGRAHYLGGDFGAAVDVAERGLGLATGDTIFRANLLALRAMGKEALGHTLEAVDSYEAAIRVHRSLFDAALSQEGGSEP